MKIQFYQLFSFQLKCFFLHHFHLLQCNLLRCFEDSIHLYVSNNVYKVTYRVLNVVVQNSENSVNGFVHWNHVFVEEVSEWVCEYVCVQFDIHTNRVRLSFLLISYCRFFSVKYGDSRIVHIRLHLHHIFKSHVVNQITTTFVNYCKLHCLSCPCTYTILKLYNTRLYPNYWRCSPNKHIKKFVFLCIVECNVVRGQLFTSWMFLNYK